MSNAADKRRQSLALFVLCLAVLMIVLDTTIVTVAMPSISADLRLSATSLTWVLNAYMLTFGGFLLLSGRLGDLYGHKRLFLLGITVFTLASIACGLAPSPSVLVAARAVQGVGGAGVMAVSLSLIMSLFSNPAEHAKALGIYGFVCAAGDGVGDLLGGILTKALSWHWIFLVNLPLGIAVYGLCTSLLPPDSPSLRPRRLDVWGAISITAAFTLAVYTFVSGSEGTRTWTQTSSLLGLVALLLVLFFGIETRVREPLMPLRLFRLRNFATANVLGVLWMAGTFAWFVIAALYMQCVLSYDPFRVGLAFAPATIIMAGFSAGFAAKLVMRLGIRTPLCMGLLLAAVGLGLFARAPSHGTFVVDVLPGMLLIGLGAGMTSTPLLLAAMSDVDAQESGLASGMVNTSFVMGGALGLAALAGLSAIRSSELRRLGLDGPAALNSGYHLAFFVGALLTVTAAVLGVLLLRPRPLSDTIAESGSTPASDPIALGK